MRSEKSKSSSKREQNNGAIPKKKKPHCRYKNELTIVVSVSKKLFSCIIDLFCLCHKRSVPLKERRTENPYTVGFSSTVILLMILGTHNQQSNGKTILINQTLNWNEAAISLHRSCLRVRHEPCGRKRISPGQHSLIEISSAHYASLGGVARSEYK